MIKEFRVKQLSSDTYKIEKASSIRLCLYDNYLTCSGWSEGLFLNDKNELFEQKSFNNNVFCEKTNISSIEYNFISELSHWSVKVHIAHSSNDLYFDFEKEQDAMDLYDYLINWKLNFNK